MVAKLKIIKNSYMTEGEETYRGIIQHIETFMSRLQGDKLRFDPADPEQGLFLVPQANGCQFFYNNAILESFLAL